MALPTTYLTSQKNLGPIFDAMRNAQAPKQFSRRFLESLGFKGSADRLVIGVLKSIGFLDDKGQPTQRYFRYLDASQSKVVLAEGIREGYGDLFEINVNAQTLSKTEIINKMKTLSQGQLSESVLDKMAMTFKALSAQADFSETAVPPRADEGTEGPEEETTIEEPDRLGLTAPGARESSFGLDYNIQLVLPDSRDPAVYDAFFDSFKRHLLQ